MDATTFQSAADQKLALSIKAACNLIDCGRTRMYALIADGQVDACKIGRNTKVTLRSLEALIERGVAAAQQTWPR